MQHKFLMVMDIKVERYSKVFIIADGSCHHFNSNNSFKYADYKVKNITVNSGYMYIECEEYKRVISGRVHND